MSFEKRMLAFVFLVLFSSTFISANGGSKHLVMNGTMNGKIAIHMDITIAGSSVSGTYYYLKQKKPITLSGTFSSETKDLKLSEMDQDKVTGYFEGELNAANVFFGTWSNPARNKSLSFVLGEEPPASATGWPLLGVYKSNNGVLYIGALATGSFGFYINAVYGQNLAEIDGRAIINGRKGDFKDTESDCRLVFTAISGGIKVEEDKCSWGVGAYAAGEYLIPKK